MKAVVHHTGRLVPVILVLGALGLGASYGIAARSNPRIATIPTSFAQVSSAIAPMSIAVFPPEIDAAKVQGAEACGECHAPELKAWKQSKHFATWTTMHRKPRAREIANALEIKGGIKRNDLCVNCHYTAQIVDEKPKPVSGVSCESCHGAAADWINVHNDYGADQTKQTESAEHREMRLKAVDASGMLRPANVYLVARNCYSCHSVPNEKLVNVGGHPAGSDFELVSWSQGEVRHNYFQNPEEGNREASVERKRVLYVVGAITDLEYALRGMSKITERGAYRDAMIKRKKSAVKRIDEILSRVSLPEIQRLMSSLERDENGLVKIDRALLNELPDQLAALSEQFVNTHDGSNLGPRPGLDALIPGPEKYHGTAQP
ncbi:MAG: cytochrome c family protein [Phycisphaerales bacterium]